MCRSRAWCIRRGRRRFRKTFPSRAREAANDPAKKRIRYRARIIDARIINRRRIGRVAVGGLSAPAAGAERGERGPAAGNLPQPSPPPAAGNPPASGNLPQPGALPPPPPAPPPKPPGKIKIIVRSIPTKANVRWGKKVLGQTPFTLERPRDS